MKIVDKMNDNISKNKIFYSFEFFPPKTDEVSRVYSQKLSIN